MIKKYSSQEAEVEKMASTPRGGIQLEESNWWTKKWKNQ
jgi:hypothetical protein